MSGAWEQSPVTGPSYLKGVIARELASVVGAEHVTDDVEARQSAAADWSWQSKFIAYKGLEQPAADFVVSPASTA